MRLLTKSWNRVENRFGDLEWMSVCDDDGGVARKIGGWRKIDRGEVS